MKNVTDLNSNIEIHKFIEPHSFNLWFYAI